MGDVIPIYELNLHKKIRKLFNLDEKHSVIKSFEGHPAFYVHNEEYNNYFTYLVGIDRNKNAVVMGFVPSTTYETLNNSDLYKYLDKGILVRGAEILDWMTWCLGKNYTIETKKDKRFVEDTMRFYYMNRLDEVFEPDIIQVDFKPFLNDEERSKFELDPYFYEKWNESREKYIESNAPDEVEEILDGIDKFDRDIEELCSMIFGPSFNNSVNIGDLVKSKEESITQSKEDESEIDRMCKEFARREFPELTDDEIDSVVDLVKEDVMDGINASCIDEDEE